MGLNFKGVDLTSPINRIPTGRVSIAQNVRAYFAGGVSFRNLLTAAIFTVSNVLHTIRRLNDTTPNGPASGYTIIAGNGTVLSAWNPTLGVVTIATGLSGNPCSMIAFRPNASVQPWMYVSDSAIAGAVSLSTKYLISGSPVAFPSNGMMKVRSDGIIYKIGIMEPQSAP